MNNKKNNKINNKNNKINKTFLTICVIIISFLIILLIFLKISGFFDTRNYNIGYLSFTATGYDLKKDDIITLNKDDKCKILLNSKFTTQNDSNDFGEIEKINGYDWEKQEFDNGVTLTSHYKNSFYIVQMFSDDKVTYENVCKKDFEKIQKTFSFKKDE